MLLFLRVDPVHPHLCMSDKFLLQCSVQACSYTSLQGVRTLNLICARPTRAFGGRALREQLRSASLPRLLHLLASAGGQFSSACLPQ